VCAESLLTIELGDRCNNRCGFCPQHYLRCSSFSQKNLATAHLVRRIAAGQKAGHTRIAFTGGEPLVRGDIVHLVDQARRHGFTHIGVTTNARMFGAGTLSSELLAAGLNRVTFSIHSQEAEVHDRLSGVQGAFEQTCAGIRVLVQAANQQNRDLELHSATLLLPDNVDDLPAIVGTAAGLGASIHVVQPFIASRSNLHVASTFFVPYTKLAAAISLAGVQAARVGTRVKPYNVPYCVLDSLDGLEMQEYGLVTHRRGETKAGHEGSYDQAQFFRIDRCQGCPTPCPGWRVEHRPVRQMASQIVEDVLALRSSRIILPGLDMLNKDGLAYVLSEIRKAGRQVMPVTGGAMWASPDDFVSTAVACAVPRVAHLLRTEWDAPGHEDPDPGNEQRLVELAAQLKEAGIANTLIVPIFDLESFPFTFGVVAEHFDEIAVVFPRYWRGLKDPGACATLLDSMAQKALSCAEKLAQLCEVYVATFESVRVLPRSSALWQKSFSFHFSSSDWSGSMARHRYASSRYNFVMWSFPFYLF
jgi:molybdenum cofactor biosynthesis enzyme MoaA